MKGCKRESGWWLPESAAKGRVAAGCLKVLQRGAQSGRTDLKGSKAVWLVCDLQREWVGTKVIGENRRGKCEVCAEIA